MSDNPTAYVFTAAQLVDVRRFCGYPVYGFGPGDDTFNRFFASYETLNYRIANLTTTEAAVVVLKLAELNTLDTAIPGAGENLDTDRAAVWFRNKTEPWDRDKLFRMRRRELCAFMGVPPGPALSGERARFVV